MSLPVTANKTKNRNEKLNAFTFWIGDSLFAIDLRFVLSIEQEGSVIQPDPFSGQGALGIVKHRGIPVRVFDLAEFIHLTSSGDQKQALIEQLVGREKDHVDWLAGLEDAIRKDIRFEKARDPHQCAFGKWYDNFESHDHELMDILAKFDEPHKRIHALADQLLALKEHGQEKEALRILALERQTTLAHLRRLFERARSQIKDRIKYVLLFITTDGKSPCLALRLNEIDDIVEFSNSQVTVTEDVGVLNHAHLSNIFTGYIDSGNERDNLLFDMDGLLAAVTENCDPANDLDSA